MADCIFCKIVDKEILANIIFEDEDCLAFDDMNPQAPVHVLIIPKKHLDHMDHAAEADEALLGRLLVAASNIAESKGIAEDGYRVVTNIGENAGQSVNHLHFHVLGGRKLTWPPG
jgi:histidine triad (HIT) family protein